MTRSEEYPFLPSSYTGKRLQRRSFAAAKLYKTKISLSLLTVIAATDDEVVTLPMHREAPANFGVKLSRPGAGPAAELPTSSSA
jgi:hypothetical protein